MSGVYRVTGARGYRGHAPGVEFHARLDERAAARAIARGDIELLRTVTPGLPPVHSLPPGWADQSTATETPAGVSPSRRE